MALRCLVGCFNPIFVNATIAHGLRDLYNTFLGHLQPRRASTGAVTAVAPTPLLHVGARNKTGGCRQQFLTSKGIELCDLAYKEQEAHRKQAFASSDLDEVFNR
jgi:hypothetical protein